MANKHNGNTNLVLKCTWKMNERNIHKLKVYSKVCSILRCFFCIFIYFLSSKIVNLVSGSRKGTAFKIKSPEIRDSLWAHTESKKL